MRIIRKDEHKCLWVSLDTSPLNVVLFIIGFNNTSINKHPLSWEQSSQDHKY